MRYHGALPNGTQTEAACVRTGTGTAAPEDQVIPFAELWDGNGRYMDCSRCSDAIAHAMGGSMQRPQPPAGS